MKAPLTLLIDADGIAYRVAAAMETATDWGDGYYTLHVDVNDCLQGVNEAIDGLVDLCSDHNEGEEPAVVLAWSVKDDRGEYHRHKLDWTYKANRTARRPMALKAVTERLHAVWDCRYVPGLEADDLLGIMQTDAIRKGRRTVVASGDKDLRTVPGDHIDLLDLERGVFHVTLEEADRAFHLQVLTGDTSDGYPGCPGIGAKSAPKVLDSGEGTTWQKIVGAYVKKGLTEADALTQARLARILRVEDFDFKTKEPRLWQSSND